MLSDLIHRNRSYRRFNESVRIGIDQMEGWVDLARLSASSRNQQALKFKMVADEDTCNRLFPYLAWAGYLPEWLGPKTGERPSGYIIILGDSELGHGFQIDLGIAAQSILLGAVEDGFGGCMIGSIQKKKIQELYEFDEHLELLLVLALGKPIEEVVIEEMKDGDIKYWRDENNIHHVPKRKLPDILV